MKKIPTLFSRGAGGLVTRELSSPSLSWVLDGSAVATKMRDGIPILIRHGHALCSVDGEWQMVDGWYAAGGAAISGLADALAYANATVPPADGSYELCGPSVKGNPEGLPQDMLISHTREVLFDKGTRFNFDALEAILRQLPREGLVFWSELGNLDAPMAKIQRRDFGHPWPLGAQ